MKIIVVGSKGAGKGAHFSEGITKAFRKMNIDVSFYDPLEFCTAAEKIYKELIPLSIFEVKQDHDFIFVDQCNFEFRNDTNSIVFYNHKYLHRHPRVFHPDVMFHACEPFKDYFIRQEHQRYCHQVKRHEILYPAVDPELYKPTKKDLRGIIGIGFRRSFDSWIKAGGIAEGPTSRIIEQEVNEFKKFGNFHDTPITDDEYKDLLSRAQATWFPIPSHQYITRRMLEAMACKTTSFIKIEGKEHEKVLKEMGYRRYIEYLPMERINDLMNSITIQKEDLLETAENAYEMTINNHTYKQRAEQILNIYEEVK